MRFVFLPACLFVASFCSLSCAPSDDERCAECGSCEQACPFEAIRIEDAVRIDTAKCLGCGVCESLCRREAIRLVRDESKAMPLDVEARSLD